MSAFQFMPIVLWIGEYRIIFPQPFNNDPNCPNRYVGQAISWETKSGISTSQSDL